MKPDLIVYIDDAIRFDSVIISPETIEELSTDIGRRNRTTATPAFYVCGQRTSRLTHRVD